MKRIPLFLVLSALCLPVPAAQASAGTLSGPFTHRNLTIFLVHGGTQLETHRYATLSEAMEKGWVVVAETGNVNQLSIENVSKDVTVFLNAGDIVKGGRQDRTVQDDLILSPSSGRVPLAAFCVEHGRWTGRAQESAAQFSGNDRVLTSRKLKIASRAANSQAEVWAGVADEQSKLNSNLGRLMGKDVETRNAASASSLQLTLENKDLDSMKSQYLAKLSSSLDGKTDVIGFAYAINGEINSAEVYNNKALFRALWPKLIDSAVTEAIAEDRADGKAPSVQASDVKTFFETAVSGPTTSDRAPWKSTRARTITTDTTILFETLDLDAGGLWIHKTFISKEKNTANVPLGRDN